MTMQKTAEQATALADLSSAGVAVWLDDLNRGRIQSGDLARMVERGDVVGVTTNPTIFAKAIGAGSGPPAWPDAREPRAWQASSISAIPCARQMRATSSRRVA